MNINLTKAFAGLFLVFIVSACSDDRWSADTSGVDYSLEIVRLDQVVFQDKTYQSSGLESLEEEYGSFLDIYLIDIMQIGPVENPMSAGLLNQFRSEPTWKQLQDVLNATFPDLNRQEIELERALKRYAVFFKANDLPKVVAYNSGYNVGVYPSNEFIGLGLEWYAGSSHEVVKMLPPDLFPQYKRDNMNPDYLVVNALKGWLYYKFQDNATGETLLSNMVFVGKIHYITEVLLEQVSESVLLNYTAEEIEWCESQEYDVWKFFLEQDLLFSKDPKSINKIVSDGPFTTGMPPESPGGIGNWVGYQMVKSFMEEKEDYSLVDLMNVQDEKEFLKYYKPGL